MPQVSENGVSNSEAVMKEKAKYYNTVEIRKNPWMRRKPSGTLVIVLESVT